MEIQKVFSSYDGYEEERIYSVLMNEEELSLFSEIQKEFASIRELKHASKVMGNGLANGGLTKGQIRTVTASGKRLNKHVAKMMNNEQLRNKVMKSSTTSVFKGAGIKDPDAIRAGVEKALSPETLEQARKTTNDFIASGGKGLPGIIKNLPRR